MKPIDILEQVARLGTCEHIKLADCKRCPLGTLKRRPDDSGWLSCFEAVCGKWCSSEEQIEKYKQKASELLALKVIEETIDE